MFQRLVYQTSLSYQVGLFDQRAHVVCLRLLRHQICTVQYYFVPQRLDHHNMSCPYSTPQQNHLRRRKVNLQDDLQCQDQESQASRH